MDNIYYYYHKAGLQPLPELKIGEPTMIMDKVIKVDTTSGVFHLTISADQQRDTIQRRMKSLMPGARILDMHEVIGDSQQPDLLSGKKPAGGK